MVKVVKDEHQRRVKVVDKLINDLGRLNDEMIAAGELFSKRHEKISTRKKLLEEIRSTSNVIRPWYEIVVEEGDYQELKSRGLKEFIRYNFNHVTRNSGDVQRQSAVLSGDISA